MPAIEGVKKMQEGFFAFHVELDTGYKLVGAIFKEHEKCGLKEIEYLHLTDPCIATQKHSDLKEIFKLG